MKRTGHPPAEWDPQAPDVRANQIAAYDAMRRRCPVAHSDHLRWSVFRHAETLRVLEDAETFSSAVSRHPSVPNGMDPPEHTAFRRIIEPYFGPRPMAAFEPECRAIAAGLVRELPAGAPVDVVAALAQPYALRAQCDFMGWPAELHQPLREWVRRNHRATRAKDRAASAAVAREFDGHVRGLLATRRAAGAGAPDDVTTRLMRETIHGRPLSDPELVSIIRNWTVGELGTLAAAVGIIVHFLALREDVQTLLRTRPELLDRAIDEILRIDPPLIANRRITTRAVELGGRALAAGARISLLWAAANRDEAVFGDPDEFRLDRDPAANLLYGAGIHVCPGAPLARMELRLVTAELLSHTGRIHLAPGRSPMRSMYPAGGYDRLEVVLDPPAEPAG